MEGAHKLINFLLRPEIAAQVAESIGYPTPNLEAKKLLPAEIANDPSLYPSEEVLQKANGKVMWGIPILFMKSISKS